MKAFIAEDEPPARERLLAELARVAPQVQVVGQADSVRATLDWLAANPAPDLLLLDIQLADGLSLELFADGRLQLPTIFTTAYDRFAIDAFRALAVDYLLKPVNPLELARAIGKAQRLRDGFAADVAALLRPQRLLGRRGARWVALPLERLAYVVALDKAAVAVDADGARYELDRPLAALEAELAAAHLFRASRQVLLAARAVAGFEPAGKGRLKVLLQPPLDGGLLISQERAAAFRAWLAG